MKATSVVLISMLFLLSSLIAGCGQDLSKTDVNQVNIERDFQNVIHTDCKGNVTSQGIETVLPPTQWVEINPSDSTNNYSPTFIDEQTNSSPSFIVGEYSFQVDYSYGALNMHVISGINAIDYSFTRCTAWSTPDANGNQTCEKTVVGESGTLTINVNYSEKTLDGSTTVSDCAPTPSPTPTPAKTILHH